MPLSIAACSSSLSLAGGVGSRPRDRRGGGVAPSSASRSMWPLFSKSTYLKWISLSLPVAPGIVIADRVRALLLVLGVDDRRVRVFVVERRRSSRAATSGRLVVWIDDGSVVVTVSTGGVQSEQNMLRAANGVPSLLRVCFDGVIGRRHDRRDLRRVLGSHPGTWPR